MVCPEAPFQLSPVSAGDMVVPLPSLTPPSSTWPCKSLLRSVMKRCGRSLSPSIEQWVAPLVLPALLCASPAQLWAEQPDEPPVGAVESSEQVDATSRQPTVGVGYLGEWFTHPGLGIDAHVPVVMKGPYVLRLGVNAAGYVHPGNHRATWFGARSIHRLGEAQGVFFDAVLGFAYLRTWPGGDVYSLNEADEVTLSRGNGQSHLMPEAYLGLGWGPGKAGERQGAPWRVTLRLGLFGEYPHNGYLLPHLASSLSFEMDLGGTP